MQLIELIIPTFFWYLAIGIIYGPISSRIIYWVYFYLLKKHRVDEKTTLLINEKIPTYLLFRDVMIKHRALKANTSLSKMRRIILFYLLWFTALFLLDISSIALSIYERDFYRLWLNIISAVPGVLLFIHVIYFYYYFKNAIMKKE